VKLTTDLHLVPRLRIDGAVPLHRLCTLKAWTVKTFHFNNIRLLLFIAV
jgi:hypothetical protein